MSYNDQSPPPLHLPSRLPDVTHVTLSPRPSPSVFAYCKRSKTGGRKVLGNKAIVVSNISCCVGYRESMVPPVGEVFQLEGRNHHDYFVVLLFCSCGVLSHVPSSTNLLDSSSFCRDTCNKPIKSKVCFFFVVVYFFLNYALNRYSLCTYQPVSTILASG